VLYSLGPSSYEFLLSSVTGSRVMMLPGYSCETGIQETNPGRIEDANGRRIGRMCNWFPGIWAYPAEWYVCDDTTHAPWYIHDNPERLISRRSIGTTCFSLRSECGKVVIPRTQMYGVTSQCIAYCLTQPETEDLFQRGQIRRVDEALGKRWRVASHRYCPLLFHLSVKDIDRSIGHYARKGWKTPPGSSIPRPQLLRSSDPTKDQNYYLSAIPEKGLERALFPLGEITKADVRKIAVATGLPTAQRGESMGICFVGQKRKFSEFLGECIFV
jgi:hypothetical protein